jgi:hypothetical protein
MLRPIPNDLLKYTAVISVCDGMDKWQNPTWMDYTVARVHLQATNEVRRTSDNAEVVLRSVLWVDGRRSTPAMDWYALQKQSEDNGRELRVAVTDIRGNGLGTFTVKTVDALPDYPSDRIHHWELGMV